jgi:hypothetical protein
MTQAAVELKVSPMVIRRLIQQKILPARQIVKHAPFVIERNDLELPAVWEAIRSVHVGVRRSSRAEDQSLLFVDV